MIVMSYNRVERRDPVKQLFPLLIDLNDNNCTVFGGGECAVAPVRILLSFGARVTLISPQLCPELEKLCREYDIRHIARRYFRGDCSNSQLCVAATDDRETNIRIATEAKAKSIPVNVTEPDAYGTFRFPRTVMDGSVTVTLSGTLSDGKMECLQKRLQKYIPATVKKMEAEKPEVTE